MPTSVSLAARKSPHPPTGTFSHCFATGEGETVAMLADQLDRIPLYNGGCDGKLAKLVYELPTGCQENTAFP
jgi:hypothetical protein